MNLLEYGLWRKTKLWLIVLVPLIVVFLFINPHISILLFIVILGRLLFVAIVRSAFEKAADNSDAKFEDTLKSFENNVKNTQTEFAKMEMEEILAITKDFSDIHVDFTEVTKQYMVTYKEKTKHFSDYRKIREWLNSLT